MEPLNYARTTIKGAERELVLAPCTAFCGPNESGKTTWLETIRLAITGKHPIGRAASSLLSLTEPKQPLIAHVRGPDAEACLTIAVTRGGRSKGGIEHTRTGAWSLLTEDEVIGLFPTVALRDLLTLGTSKSREALFTRFGELPALIRPISLTATQKTIWDEAVSDAKGKTPVEQLGNLGSVFRSMVISIGREVSSMEAELAKIAGVAQMVASADRLRDLEQELARAHKAEAYTDPSPELRRHEDILAELKNEARSYKSLVAKWDAKRPELQERVNEFERQLADLGAGREELQEGCRPSRNKLEEIYRLQSSINDFDVDADSCHVCGSPIKVADVETRLKLQEAELLAELLPVDAKLEEIDRSHEKLTHERAKLMAAMQRNEDNLRSTRDNLKRRIDSTKSTITALTAQQSNEDFASVRPSFEVQKEMDQLREHEAMRINYELTAKRLEDFRARQAAVKACQKAAKSMLDTFLSVVATAAEETINKYMPEGFEAKLDLEAVTWSVRGMDGQLRAPGLQPGAQERALACALMLGWVHGKPIKFITIDDDDLKGLDPANTRKFLAKLRDLQAAGEITQVFVAHSRPDEIPEGYKIHDVAAMRG